MKKKFSLTELPVIWRAGLPVACCLIFLGGIKAEKMSRTNPEKEQADFAVAVTAAESAGGRIQWREVAEKHPELIIRAASSEFRF